MSTYVSETYKGPLKIEVIVVDEGAGSAEALRKLTPKLFSSMAKAPPWQRPSSAPVPSQGAPGGSWQPDTPRARPSLGVRARHLQAAIFTACGHGRHSDFVVIAGDVITDIDFARLADMHRLHGAAVS